MFDGRGIWIVVGLVVALLGLIIITTLTIAALKKKIRKLVDENKELKEKVVAMKIKQIYKKGDYNRVVIGLKGKKESFAHRHEYAEIEIEAKKISDEIQVGKLLELQN